MKVLLWETRTSKGFTLMELAKKSGIGKSTLNNIENGKVSPTLFQLETIAIALTAAETGHLVLATLHTQDVMSSVSRILDALPKSQQQVRTQLAECLQAVVCQKLLVRADGAGRVAAFEVLIATDALRNLIREGKTHQLASYVQTGARYGMVTMADYIASLKKQGIVI